MVLQRRYRAACRWDPHRGRFFGANEMESRPYERLAAAAAGIQGLRLREDPPLDLRLGGFPAVLLRTPRPTRGTPQGSSCNGACDSAFVTSQRRISARRSRNEVLQEVSTKQIHQRPMMTFPRLGHPPPPQRAGSYADKGDVQLGLFTDKDDVLTKLHADKDSTHEARRGPSWGCHAGHGMGAAGRRVTSAVGNGQRDFDAALTFDACSITSRPWPPIFYTREGDDSNPIWDGNASGWCTNALPLPEPERGTEVVDRQPLLQKCGARAENPQASEIKLHQTTGPTGSASG
ncbi:hypothetical protein DFH08DRAFT_820476 [Mycena albidolilacea]|uniref:Uncharacterized protein n=1 Tax=Mycena albidolilacea TaxID=1033008 RepID=A0AAD6ZC12_9AGAR|nr:hypothetical protein DFH08DRAFT_820476 [Mycena albidolilacea]